MYGGLQTLLHLAAGNLAGYEQGYELIFEAVINQIVGSDALSNQFFHLCGHPFGKPFLKPPGDASAPLVAVQIEGYQHMLHRLYLRAVAQPVLLRMMQIIILYLYASQSSFAGVGVSCIVQFLHAAQQLRQFLQALVGEALPQFLIHGNVGHPHSIEGVLHIHSCASAKHRHFSALPHFSLGRVIVAEKFLKIIFVSGLAYVYEMIPHWLAAAFPVLVKVFACADVHAAIHLPRVGTDNLALNGTSRRHSFACLAACRGTGNGQYDS